QTSQPWSWSQVGVAREAYTGNLSRETCYNAPKICWSAPDYQIDSPEWDGACARLQRENSRHISERDGNRHSAGLQPGEAGGFRRRFAVPKNKPDGPANRPPPRPPFRQK